ncbi:non-ribosomal peptide synthetase [Aquisphaera insulae]|uniref:non-ribosomal peptide synthetase n=1 Tax=Aquisphaera insulae TaxID=2712864 RepID=UPI0013EA8602|nr:non-ribosomal peptide synthetase [Aquisphaera insulae]
MSECLDQLRLAAPASRERQLANVIRDRLAEFLGYDSAEDVGAGETFAELGADSSQAVEFKLILDDLLDMRLSSTVLFQHPTAERLAAYLIEELGDRLDGAGTRVREIRSAPPDGPKWEDVRPGPEVAIVAVACRFPGASGSAALFQKSLEGRYLAIGDGPGLGYGRLDDSRVEDRQGRSTFEVIDELLSRREAGRCRFATRKTGVFLNAELPCEGADATAPAYRVPLANRVSFRFDLRGPSETVNAFCAGAYLSLHRAVLALRAGECRQAIVGGVNLIDGDGFRRAADSGAYAALLAADNHVRSFGRKACGFVRSEGIGVALLKPLGEAEEDGDEILALVRGVAVEHGGRGFSMEAPNVEAIAGTALRCLRRAGLRPEDVGYLEAHGIGNPFADALELAALRRVYTSRDAAISWHLSCVKPSVGHPELASGMASLIKAIEAIRSRTLPPLATAGDLIDDLPEGHRFVFESSPIPWSPGVGPRRVALNSYSIGGLNAHVILEEPPVGLHAPGDRRPARSRWDDADGRADESRGDAKVPAEAATGLLSLAAEVFEIDAGRIDGSLSFAKMGLDSIKIVEFIQRANEELGMDLRFSEVITAGRFGDILNRGGDRPGRREPIRAPRGVVAGQRFPASETQRGMWYVSEVLDRSTSYNVPILMHLAAPLDRDRFERVMEGVLDDHPALRVAFVPDAGSGEIVQQVLPAPGLVSLRTLDLGGDDPPRERMVRELRRPFPLGMGPLMRAFHVRRDGAGESVLLIVHHLIIDGFSAVRLVNEIWRRYDSTVPPDGRGPAAPEAEAALFDFVDWERGYLLGCQAEADRRYWVEHLRGVCPRLDLPSDAGFIPPDRAVGVGCESTTLESEPLRSVKALAARCHASPSATMLAAFFAFLGRVSGQDDMAVTTPVGLRPRPRFRDGIGCFLNLVVTRARPAPERPFAELLREVRESFASGIDHCAYPYSRLLPDLGLSLNHRAESAFPISFTYQNIFEEWGGSLELGSAARVDMDLYQEVEDDLTLEVYDFRDSIRINLKYRRSELLPETARRFLEGYCSLLLDAASRPDATVASLGALPEPHRRMLLERLGRSDRPAEEARDVVEAIDRNAEIAPDAVAVLSGGIAATYAELRGRSLALAEELRRLGVRPGGVVGVRIARSTEFIVATLAVLRCGAAYLPIDVDAPGRRAAEQLADSGAVGVLGRGMRFEPLSSSPAPLDRRRHASGLAYILYTSGTTGRPKGVGIRRSSLGNLCRAMASLYGLSSADRVLQFAPPTFDMSVEEIFPALTVGAAVVIRAEEDLAPDRFARLVRDQRVTIANLPPSFHDALRSLGDDRLRDLYGRLRIVAFGGDRLSDEILRFLKGLPTRVFNAYGPTECTVNVSVAELTGGRRVHIGRPLPGVEVYILSDGMDLLPPGAKGELCVAGAGVATGYLDPAADYRPSFVPNPFGDGLLYRTGDRARWLPDGNLEILGRLDEQLSILGHRVEPAEVEAALSEHPDVDRVAVVGVPGDGGLCRLVAYYQSRRSIDRAEWRGRLRERLPAFMVPSTLCPVDEMPVTEQGKIDRRELARRGVVDESRPPYVPPATPSERLVAEVFERVLRRQPIGLRDNFFDLGGHSLLAIQITAEIGRDSRRHVPLRDFFSARDVGAVAEAIDRCPEEADAIELSMFGEGSLELVL